MNTKDLTEARNNVMRLEKRMINLFNAGKYASETYRDVRTAWIFWKDTLAELATEIV